MSELRKEDRFDLIISEKFMKLCCETVTLDQDDFYDSVSHIGSHERDEDNDD